MSFYENIHKYYDKIFPLKLKQVNFIKSIIPLHTRVLEVGSAKGFLTNALSKYYEVLGVDLDESFVAESRKLFPNIEFKSMNMLDIDNVLKHHSLDGIICFGNTLVHLKDSSEVELFFKNCKNVLKKNGKLIIQIINYDRIYKLDLDGLPTIQNEHIEFKRDYIKLDDRIIFNSVLKVYETSEVYKNSIELYPIRKAELKKLLVSNAFKNIKFYSGFDKETYSEEKIPLIVTCNI